jgi:hypothetical protein
MCNEIISLYDVMLVENPCNITFSLNKKIVKQSILHMGGPSVLLEFEGVSFISSYHFIYANTKLINPPFSRHTCKGFVSSTSKF